MAHGLSPYVNDAGSDPDGDGLSNYQEYLANSDPWSGSMVVAWGRNSSGQCNVPANLRDVVAVAGGERSSFALKTDGRVVAWGVGPTNPPASLTNATRIAANGYGSCSTPTGFGLALSNGVAVEWGTALADPSVNLSGVREIAAGAFHAFALKNNGTVVAWGNTNQWAAKVPGGLSSVQAIATGWHHGVALLSNGTVTAWGLYAPEIGYTLTNVPAGLSDVAAISAYGLHTLALRNDGNVVAWGYNQCGQANVPSGLSNVVSVAAGVAHNLALKQGGTVTAWGIIAPTPTGLDQVTAIASGQDHCLAVRAGRLTPVIINSPASCSALNGGSVSLSVTVASLAAPTYQWQHNGVNLSGATNATLNLTGLTTNQAGGYRVLVCNGAGCALSPAGTLNVISPTPPIITGVYPLAPGVVWSQTRIMLTVKATAVGLEFYPIHYQWKRNGIALTNQTLPDYFLQGAEVPGDILTVEVANALGSTNVGPWLVRALEAGGVVAWGANYNGQAEPPALLTNVVAVAGGYTHGVALTEEGRVYAWGGNQHGQTNIPANLTNVTAIACGNGHTLALRTDGTLAVWGRTNHGLWDIPADCTNAVKIAAGGLHNLVLKQDGSLQEWGTNYGTIPATATNITAIAAGYGFDLALRADGTIVSWGYSGWSQATIPADLTNVVAIAAGESHALALKRDGRVVAWGANLSGQTNVPTDLTNAMAIAANGSVSMALRNDGKVRVWGQADHGITNAMPGLPLVKAIGVGGSTAYAALYSPFTQYPVDVTQDLLLIYNTNSPASGVVKNHYLAHRPMAANANVLGIGCSAGEFMNTNEFDNELEGRLKDWMNANPTKYPSYVILFLDVPARITNANVLLNPKHGGSVSSALREAIRGFKPFVTHINMGDTNTCKAYIDKLESMGNTYSPGKVVISASAGGYGNDRYYFDESGRDPTGVTFLQRAYDVVVSAGLSTNSATYAGPTNAAVAVASNVTAYVSWGVHGGRASDYATNGTIFFQGSSSWYLISTIESYNGQAVQDSPQGNYIRWFSRFAFGGTDWLNTPAGAIGSYSRTLLRNKRRWAVLPLLGWRS